LRAKIVNLDKTNVVQRGLSENVAITFRFFNEYGSTSKKGITSHLLKFIIVAFPQYQLVLLLHFASGCHRWVW